MNLDSICRWAAALILFGGWLALVVMKMTPVEPLVTFVSMTLVGIATHGATRAANPSPSAPTTSDTALPNGTPRPPLFVKGQEGYFTLPGILTILTLSLILGALLLSGCAQVVPAVQKLHDEEVTTWKEMACNTTVGALARHPEVIGPIYQLCFPTVTPPAGAKP